MSKYILYSFFIYFAIMHTVKSYSVMKVLKNNPIAAALEKNKITAAIQENIANNSVTNFVKNGIRLNCLGIPVDLFAGVVENVFTQTTNAEDVRFHFYSRDQREPVTILAKTNNSLDLAKINFSTRRKTVIISHGFMSSGTVDWVKNMTKAFLQLDDVNVIVVDWEQGSNTWNYVAAATSTRIVGTQIAKLLSKIKQSAQATYNEPSKKFGNLHFVGHSLGAHICAHASYQIQQLEKNDGQRWNVQRVTGLDPAQPCFTTADLTLKLDESDAPYVDVIHTNAGQLMSFGLGLPGQLGNDDFYPNGGQVQLGCDDIDPSIWKSVMLPATLIKRTVCSHGRSYGLFTDSILVKLSGACTYQGHAWNRKYENLTQLLSEQCYGVCPELGINAIKYYNPKKNGTWFVPTGDKPHFCEITRDNKSAIKKQLRRDQMADEGDLAGLIAGRVFG